MPIPVGYDEFTVQISYVLNTGLAQMPSADGQTSKIVQAQGPCGRKVVAWRVKRTGARPALPHPDPQNDNEVLASGIIKTVAPMQMMDKTDQVMVEGIYEYLLKRPVWVDQPLPMGNTAVSGKQASAYVIQPSDFDKAMLAGTSITPQEIQASHFGIIQ